MRWKDGLNELCDNNKLNPLVVIGGPTGAGKSSLAVRLAREIGGEIISADSIQVYRGFDIGSAKITAGEMEGVPHYLIDILDPGESFGVDKFAELSGESIEKIYRNNHIPIVTGGTGFYIRALLFGTDFSGEPEHDQSYRQELMRLGEEELYNRLTESDKEYAATVHSHNKKRVVRALEYLYYTGEKFSDYNERMRNIPAKYNYSFFALIRDRKNLYENIEKRVDIMLEQGLLSEVSELLKKGFGSCQGMQGIGYKEPKEYLSGNISYEEFVDQLKKNTRHFAKRQLTWLKKEQNVEYINLDICDMEAALKIIKENLKSNGII